MTKNILAKFVFNQDIRTISAIATYLNCSISDIFIQYLHKILPILLISCLDSTVDIDYAIFNWVEKNLFKNERNFYELLMERPRSLVNELIFICGSGLYTESTNKQRNHTSDVAQQSLAYLARLYQ